jgi:hypothetical protein
MTCKSGDKFRLQSSDNNEITANADNLDICTATKILERLHDDFTKKYASSQVSNNATKPTYYLRNQEHTASQPTNQFYTIFTTKTNSDPEFKKAVSVIMKGTEDVKNDTYLTIPQEISGLQDFNEPDKFKGIYGLNRMNELLEKKIEDKVTQIRGSFTNANKLEEATKYEERKNIMTTYEEIARRENQIYREKFLNLILIVVGIFIVSTQLVQKYFSFGGGGGGGGIGIGTSNVFTGIGSSGSGLFSRFGGLGLGTSGRSRVGQLFSNNPYSLSQR